MVLSWKKSLCQLIQISIMYFSTNIMELKQIIFTIKMNCFSLSHVDFSSIVLIVNHQHLFKWNCALIGC